MARVLVAMSGGVDSSVAALVAMRAGHEVVGATMKLWGGKTDSGCCSVSDVEDARRVADRLGIDHYVLNFEEAFERHVVSPYVEAYRDGLTPNPCVECNRHLKFAALTDRAARLGFEMVATGHHARIVTRDGHRRLLRGRDGAKDQSYVLSCLERDQLAMLYLPVGELTKADVREMAAEAGLKTAGKPDSQEVCFVAGGSSPAARASFLSPRIELHRASVVDESGSVLGEVEAMELVTIGQRRGVGVALGERRYVTALDYERHEVVVGPESSLENREVHLEKRTFTGEALAAGSEVLVQTSAHGRTARAVTTPGGLQLLESRRRIAPGQVVALYDEERGEEVLGSGVVVERRKVA